MRDADKAKERLMDELKNLRKHIADHKQTEKALRESERRYRILMEHMAVTAFTLDGDWNFTFLAPGFEEITGHHIQDLIWHPFTEVLAPECAEAALDRFGTNTPYKTKFVHRDGGRIPVELCLIPMLDNEGQPTGVILGAVRDLSDSRQRMAELLQEQKLESIGALAGGIAHDFNNVLTAILGNISLAKMYVETEEAADKVLGRLTEAEEASIQARSLTQQLLTFSRGGTPVKKVISMAELLRDSASFALCGSNIKGEFSIPDDLWPVEADEGQIRQVISNMVINAGQAMPEGGIVRICAENVIIEAEHKLPLQPGAYIKISVEDQGVGIPQEHLPRIFDPYFTTKHRRSGLGLATSCSIIRKHEGHISVESQVGVGTTFCIHLPARSEEAPARREQAKEEAREGATIDEGRILVMDDQEFIRDFVSEFLSSIGYEVTTAVSGAEAIGLYREAMESGQPYDAVILDLTVPGGMGGKEAIQKLIEIDPEIKAVVSSGYSDDPIMSDFSAYGFKDAVAKPYQLQALSDALHRVIAGNVP